ncbi:hypothetical protein DYQ86_16260 [Acidobacteria bacterium AB60]|nr:hypothetical protein DYQ86_16260 [Acidobacteria bacterium AB60]
MSNSVQYSLDFTQKVPPAAQERIAAGMKQADENADPKWRHIFDACVLAAAKKKREITSDDVLAEVEALPNAPSTHNLAAIGPAMKRAAQMGVIARTDRFSRSARPEKNGNLHAVWLSKFYSESQ